MRKTIQNIGRQKGLAFVPKKGRRANRGLEGVSVLADPKYTIGKGGRIEKSGRQSDTGRA